jgi:hypothetical protein
VSRFGELRGIDGIRPVRRMEIQPYTSARLTRAPLQEENPFFRSNDSRIAGGADVKVGLTSGLTLTATINPDFGQVELDPAVINLSAFESFFNERRPFFVEGADVFRFGQVRTNINLDGQTFFYSRRIGRSPQRVLQGSNFVYVDAPQETAILGAAKVTGKVGPWTVGVMNALTNRESARYVGLDGEHHVTPVEPGTNYFLSRVQREQNAGNSVIGGMFSATHRRLTEEEPLHPMLRSESFFGGRTSNTTGRTGSGRFPGTWRGATYAARRRRSSGRSARRPATSSARTPPMCSSTPTAPLSPATSVSSRSGTWGDTT